MRNRANKLVPKSAGDHTPDRSRTVSMLLVWPADWSLFCWSFLFPERQFQKSDSTIDVSDIPPLTDEQLAQMVPFRLRSKTTLISFRVQNDVLAWLRSKGPGHLSRINAILANVMEGEQRLKSA
jgi:uncharacterized protein (DUF4415 family)